MNNKEIYMRPIGFKVINNEAYIHEYKLSDLAKNIKLHYM